jgi:hypothetical protein
MLCISHRQREAFREAAREHFMNEMVVHAKAFSPQLCRTLGEEQLRLAIEAAVSRAGDYGFTQRGPVKLYVELVFLFGSSFDSDPQYPWARSILEAREGHSQMHRAELLYGRTKDYLEHVVGQDDIHAVEALERISVFARSSKSQAWLRFLAEPEQAVRSLYPEKAAYVGGEAIQALVGAARREAAARGIGIEDGHVLACLLMFAFGYGCLSDPLYPWISNTLQDSRIDGAEKRVHRLENKALTWLDHVLASARQEPQL